MEKFNLVKSLTRVINNVTSLPFREGLGLGRMLILSLALTTFGVSNVWGYSSTKLIANAVGGGKVAVTTSTSKPSSYSSSDSKTQGPHGFFDTNVEDTYYVWVSPNSGFSASISDGIWNNSGYFVVKAPGNLSKSDPKEKTVTVTFTATFYGKAKAYADPAAGGGTWISLNGNWPTSDANYIAEDNSTKNENTTAAPTFNAQYDAKAKDGYEFVGWYTANNGGGTKKSSTVRYTEAFTASSVDQNAPTTIIRYAYFKALQYYYFKAQAGKVGAGNVYASFSDGSYSATSDIKTERATTLAQSQSTGTYAAYFKAEETDAAYHFAGWYTDAACTEANRVSTNLTYSEQISGSTATTEASAKTITRYAKFVQELTPEVTANYSGSPKAMFVDDEIASAFSFLNTSEIGSGLSFVSSNNNIITYDAANNKVIAKNEGTATLTFTQTKQDIIKAGEFVFSFNVSKIANTLAADATHSMKVDETWSNVISGKNSDATVTTTTSDETVAYYDVASNTIVAQNSGQVKITIHQGETYKFTEANKEITVTVNKWDNTLAWMGPSSMVWWSNQASVQASGNSDATISYSVVDERYGSYDAVNHILYSHNINGQLQVTATQTETYKYKGTSVTLIVNVSKANNHVEFTLNESLCDIMRTSDKSGSYAWDGGIRLGEPFGGGFNYDDKYVVLKFSGIPDKLSCSFSGGSTGLLYQVYQSSDGSNWGSAVVDEAKAGSANKQLAPTTRYLKFLYSGNFAGTFSDIKVTELKTFLTSTNEIDFGSNKKDIACANQTFTFNYANVGHKVVLETSDPHFSVSPTSITNIGGEKYGTQTITVSYSTDEVHSATNAKLTIKDELGNSKEVTLKGSTTKKAQTLKWEKPYDIEEPAIPIGKTTTGVATASSNLGVIYESSDETIIEIVDDGKAFKAIKEGSATITAKQVGTDDWEEASISKLFKTTNKIIQVISWNQNFTRLLTTYGSQELTAIVNLENAETGEQTYSKERSDLITYTSQNTSIVSVNGSTLTIVDKGETTLTATVPGDDLYESATVTIPIKVREPSAGCEDVLLGNDFGSDEYEFFHYSLTSDMEKVVKIDRTTSAIPGVLSFQHKGKKWLASYSGTIVVYESTNNEQSWNYLGEITPTVDKYNTQTYNLSRNATHVKFFRGKSATGYHYIKNVEISPAQFIESDISGNKIEFGVISVNSVEPKDFSLKYANVKDNLSVNKSSSDISLSCGDIIDLDCGATGTTPITITFSPKVVGDFSDDIQFLDKNSGKNYTLKITAKVEKSTQHITWNPSKTEYRTIDQIELNATASSNNPVQYYVKDGKDIADFVNGVLTIKKDGQITIRAHEPGDALWAPAVDVDKTFTIRKTNLHFDPLPTAATFTYPQALSESSLTDGVVKDEDGNVVAGTIAWTNPTTQLNAGENQTQGITFSPTNNVAWYNSLTSRVTVTVQKAQPNAHAQAGDIIYGAAVQTSTLTNEGTTEGTWSWTDEKKGQVLNVGTYEELQVHFTPTDKTNYNEIDGTVSLTVTKAQPTITWTSATAFEWGEINNYFVASNGGEVVMSSLDESIATIQNNKIIPIKAGTVAIQGDMAESDNYQSATLTQTITINVPSENKFTNAAGDNDWNNPTNWSAGLVPEKTEEVDIVVSGELNIKEEVVVGSLTIEDGGSVNVLQGGDLTIQAESGEADAFGDLYVKNGGDVTLNGTLNVHDFVIESSIGTADGSSKSGQITNADKLTFNEGDAYIDIHLDPSGSADDVQWYAFTVPFEVDIATGVYRQENDGSFKQLKDKTNFDIMQYNPAKRLTTGKGWEYYHGILHPGEFYYLAIDGTNNVYRFRKKAGVGFTTEAQVELHTNGDISNPNANWNPVGNPCLRYTTTDYDGFVQVYKNGQSAYLTVDASDVTYVVGCPFFVQAQEEGSLLLETSGSAEGQFYAPRRMAVDKTKNQIQLLNQGKVEDQIFIMASEDATSDYEAGSDLLKAGVSKLCGQMWINAYGQQLSVQDAPLQDETALYNLSLYAPKAGEYMLHVGSQTNYSEIYLTLNGIIIWNLSQSDYPISLFKGTTNEYGLVFQRTQPNTPTDIVSPTKGNRVDKFIHHEQMYILHNGQLYNATGAMVK